VPFVFVPVGPRNYFAVDLGLDRDDPLSAMEAISNGEEILIDRRRDRRRVFVNNVNLGV
jgi:diacylglycerol kinase family enzyme